MVADDHIPVVSAQILGTVPDHFDIGYMQRSEQATVTADPEIDDVVHPVSQYRATGSR